ncbi:MAG TPA: hypothetical protein VMU01_08585 [Rhizomicrobium sp.]|nr:hypothetical protein [Rhizomicrobium sp.]
MWKRLAVAWAVTAALIVVLFLPINTTHALKLDMPNGGQAPPQQIEATARAFTLGVEALIILAILGVCVWLNIRIIRRYRKPG